MSFMAVLQGGLAETQPVPAELCVWQAAGACWALCLAAPGLYWCCMLAAAVSAGVL